ncbi:MAG: hypothetical protein JWO79_4642, partial [Actinomycetia bacterium]|nr:hypothetical protein [Actinomycetes bacterium]
PAPRFEQPRAYDSPEHSAPAAPEWPPSESNGHHQAAFAPPLAAQDPAAHGSAPRFAGPLDATDPGPAQRYAGPLDVTDPGPSPRIPGAPEPAPQYAHQPAQPPAEPQYELQPDPPAAPPAAQAPQAAQHQPGERSTNALAEAAAELLPWARARLRQLVELESPAGDAAALDELGAAILAGHAETGAQTMPLAGPQGDHLLSCWDGADPALPPLVLIGHHDTGWPAGTLALLPCTDDGTAITGPGAWAGKSGIVVAEMALRILNLTGRAPAQPVRLLISADATQGSPTARPYVLAEANRAGAVLGLGAPHPDGRLVTGRHGSVRVLVKVRAEDDGVSAIEELTGQLSAVRSVVPPGVSLNVGRIGGGTDAHEIAALAGADIGVTFADPQSEQGAMSAFAALRAFRPGAVVTAEALPAVPAWPVESGERLLSWAGTVGERYGLPVSGSPAPVSGDVNFAGAQGVPVLDGFGAVGERRRTATTTDDRVRVDSLVPRAVLLAALLARPLPLADLR